MELTIQIVTNNDELAIERTLDSARSIDAHIMIGDLGSTDSTLSICDRYGVEVVHVDHMDHSRARNDLVGFSHSDWQLYLNPGEVLVQGQEALKTASYDYYYFSILRDAFLSKEIRLWKKSSGVKFSNPVYEFLDCNTDRELGVLIYSEVTPDFANNLSIIEKWKVDQPLAKEPYYFQALTFLAQQKYDDFLRVAEHYMFINKKTSISATMIRYYYALVQLKHNKKVTPVLQNLNLCLCVRPLMAEFWCLLGDVYYHLLQRFDLAKEYYEYAIIMGSRRLRTDKWPMDISKYKEYPSRMISSCDKLLLQFAYETKTVSK